MKKTFFLLIIVAWQVSVFAQAYIGNKLYDELLLSADDSFIPVNIYLSKQLDVDSLHQEFRDRKVPVHQRAKTVMHKLQQLSGVSQKNLLQFINKEVGQDAKNLRSFWIINMVSVKAKPEMIFRIAERKDVAIIELNSPRLKIEQPVKILNHAAKQRSTAEPGLIAINAHKLWAMGYTGKNRVGMNVDTGVNFKHPAISNNYLGKYLPIDQCWFPFNNPTPYDISDHSHGTHTIGTMMGLDPATNDTIGAAYNAHWISSDPIVSDLYYLRTLPEVMSSFEWALNPDGDTATVFDMPDVINNSWGWVDPPDTFQCNSPYTAVMDVCEAAGIAVVFSAGNDGELGAGTVGEPALKAKNLVNAFAVGSVNANIPSLQISIFSSRGPTVCADTGSLQIKPEVVAPGQDVRSAMGQNDYGMLSGTSMAGPHVAGAILLLKEAFPFLSGEEIKLALYFSAVDLGPAGEDNTYGNGIIDVLAAYNFLSLTYTPVSPVSNNWELVLDEIISPSENFTCNSIINPEIKFRNDGINSISEIEIKLFADKIEILDTSWTGNLSTGQSELFSMPAINLLPGYHIIQVELLIDGNPDEFNKFNNFGIFEFRIVEDFNLPYFEDFDTVNKLLTNTPWIINNPDNLISWKPDTCSGLPNSEKSLFMDYFYYEPELGQIDDLISPLLNMPDTGGVELTYDIAYRQRRSWTDDSLKVYVSTDCGASFPYLLFANGGNSLETFPYNLGTVRFYPETADHWRKDTIDLSQFTGIGQIMLKFAGINDRGNSLWLDNIEIKGKPGVVRIDKISTTAFNIFPNPASNRLYIVFDKKPIHDSKISIHNIDGKLIEHFSGQKQNINIAINNYADGIYFVRLRSVDGVKVKRFSVVK